MQIGEFTAISQDGSDQIIRVMIDGDHLTDTYLLIEDEDGSVDVVYDIPEHLEDDIAEMFDIWLLEQDGEE